MISRPHWFDRFPHGAGAQAAAFGWGLAEATVFLILAVRWIAFYTVYFATFGW